MNIFKLELKYVILKFIYVYIYITILISFYDLILFMRKFLNIKVIVINFSGRFS